MNSDTQVIPATAQPYGKTWNFFHLSDISIQPDGEESFSADRISPFRHNLSRHPLFQLPRLARLAHDLMPAEKCRFIQPTATQTSKFSHASAVPRGQSIDALFEHIEKPGTWLALYDIQTDPEYRVLLDEAIESTKPLFESSQLGLFHIAGYFLFLHSLYYVFSFRL